jgi:hypothetical protein
MANERPGRGTGLPTWGKPAGGHRTRVANACQSLKMRKKRPLAGATRWRRVANPHGFGSCRSACSATSGCGSVQRSRSVNQGLLGHLWAWDCSAAACHHGQRCQQPSPSPPPPFLVALLKSLREGSRCTVVPGSHAAPFGVLCGVRMRPHTPRDQLQRANPLTRWHPGMWGPRDRVRCACVGRPASNGPSQLPGLI